MMAALVVQASVFDALVDEVRQAGVTGAAGAQGALGAESTSLLLSSHFTPSDLAMWLFELGSDPVTGGRNRTALYELSQVSAWRPMGGL
jgi:hypothetical protein